jgi:hypothetical protein
MKHARAIACVTLGLACLLCTAGCSGKYKQDHLGSDSPQAAQIEGMISSLRKGGVDGLDAFMAANAPSDLTDGQKKALRAGLEPLVGAKAVKVQRVDRFGDKVYRASLSVTADGRERTVFFLLVESGDQLLWAGPN